MALSRYYTYAVEEGSFGESETGRVSELTHTVGSTMTEYSYTYDARGNITHIYIGGVLKYSYAYDNLNQLVRENNAVANKTYVYTYDDAGNILTKKTYAYTTGTLGSVTSTNTYTYGNSAWGDQLTAFNGTSLSYDALGNPLSYYNGTSYTFTWAKGRQLASTVKGGVTTAYTYNADGICTGKTVGSKTVKYVLSGTKIVAEINNGVDIRYLYDPQGSPVGMILAGTTYLYEKNLQGDIIGIYNVSGTKVASYTYDAWGNVVSSSYSDYNAYTYNPFRYRGYYYDTETGFYYLQSRYYDPTTGRFLNADVYISTGQGLTGFNMYAYCGNNPVDNIDDSGMCYYGADGEWYHDNWEYLGGYVRRSEPVDITEKLDNAMKENAATIKDILERGDKPLAILYFVNKVKPGGEWDFKSQAEWNLDSNTIYLYNGTQLRFDDIGNIHYGYVGRVLFLEHTLLLAGGLVQIRTGTSELEYVTSNFDDPRDQWAIRFGSSIWEEDNER